MGRCRSEKYTRSSIASVAGRDELCIVGKRVYVGTRLRQSLYAVNACLMSMEGDGRARYEVESVATGKTVQLTICQSDLQRIVE